MSSPLLRRMLLPRATAFNTFFSTSPTKNTTSPTTTDSTAVTTAVSILTHHRSKSRWTTLLSLFPNGLTPPQISQIILQIRNNPHLALSFFTSQKHHSLHSYATIIHTLARARQRGRAHTLIKQALRVFDLCNDQSCDLFKVLVETYRLCDSAPFVFDLLVISYLDMNRLDPCFDVVRMLKSRGICVSVGTCNALISSASKIRGCFFGFDLYKELFVFDDNYNGSNVHGGGIVVTRMVVGQTVTGAKHGASGCKVMPNVHTFNELMVSFARNGLIGMVEEVWIEMTKWKCNPNSCSYSILMEVYCEEGEIEKAKSVWEELKLKGLKPDIVANNTMIGGYCKVGKVEESEELYREMVLRGLEGTCVTYQHLVNGYCLAKDADSAMLLYKDMRRKGFCPDGAVIDSMIDVLCDTKPIPEALEFFRIAVENGDCVARETSYVRLIKGLCDEGMMDDALKLQAQMVGKGFGPNSDLYRVFIDGYMKLGKMNVAERLRKEMMTT